MLGPMAKELGINIKDFVDLVRCPLTIEEYLNKRKERFVEGIKIIKR